MTQSWDEKSTGTDPEMEDRHESIKRAAWRTFKYFKEERV
jgi:hypothetical protein